MRFIKILLIYIKRQLKNPSFFVGAALIPLLLPLALNFSTGGEQGLKAGVFGGDEQVCSALAKSEGIVEFEIYRSEEELTRDVENASLNCGYILPSDMYTAFKENRHGAVTCLKSPSSMLVRVSNEALFSALSSLYANRVASDYMAEKGIKYSEKRLEEYSKSYIENKNATYIEYSYGSERKDEKKTEPLSDTLLGLTGLYILLGGVLSVNLWIKDEKRFVPLGCFNVAASELVLTLWGGCVLFAYRGFDMETALRLAVFAVLSFAFCIILKSLCKKVSVICGALPVIVCGSLVLCPVFIDISAFAPALSAAGYIFPVFYLLGSMKMLIGGAVAFMSAALLSVYCKLW